ncbi:MAG: hypothetical protein HC825_02105 [Oscillatoriales cyanobacterium RM1_1_9]|nr:hypothetical protein [Oscillatoriales cyanobacterium SM2_3_0]NJO70816.1 hypothetical protein [Oscillatoriales cyanobacterium RM1_1_9]
MAQVWAEAQASHLQSLEPYLSEAERNILRRGRNATAARGPKRLEPGIYQQATSLEALIGYLHLTNPNRLSELLAHLNLSSE